MPNSRALSGAAIVRRLGWRCRNQAARAESRVGKGAGSVFSVFVGRAGWERRCPKMSAPRLLRATAAGQPHANTD